MTDAEKFDAAQARLKAEQLEHLGPQTLLAALLAVQKELPSISLQKTGKNPAFKSKYLTLDGLHAAILPLLNKYGLVWTTRPEVGQDGPVLAYKLQHVVSRESEIGEMPLMLDKQNSQGLGSAVTYARRYSLCSIIGAVGDSDDDGAAASIPRSEQPTKAEKPDNSRLLTDEERAAVLKAMSGHRDKDMLLRSVGCDDLDHLTVGMAWELRRKLGPEAPAK